MRGARHLHPIRCRCRTCQPLRQRAPATDRAKTAAAKILALCAELLVMISPPAHECPDDVPHCGQTWLCYRCHRIAQR